MGVTIFSSDLGVEFPEVESLRTFRWAIATTVSMCSEFSGYSHLIKIFDKTVFVKKSITNKKRFLKLF